MLLAVFHAELNPLSKTNGLTYVSERFDLNLHLGKHSPIAAVTG